MIFNEWQSRHRLNRDEFQTEFEALDAQGYRTIKVSVYPEGGEARFTGIWHKRGGNAFFVVHGKSRAEFETAVADMARDGNRPTHVSAALVATETLFCAVFERVNGIESKIQISETLGEYETLFDELSDDGYRLRCLSFFEEDSQAKVASIWERYAGPDWQSWTGLSAEEYQEKFNEMYDAGYRIVQCIGYTIGGLTEFAGIWEKSLGHAWQAQHGIPEELHVSLFDGNSADGYRLVDLCGLEMNGAPTFCTIWEEGSTHYAYPNDPSSVVIPFMQRWNVPALSYAVARDGNIITTRQFGYANPFTREILTPETRFRVASISKPITAVAILQLIENGSLNLGDTVFGVSGLLGTKYGTQPYAANITSITVEQLLKHTSGGWLLSGSDPMFSNPGLITETLINTVLDSNPLTDAPGAKYRYSNFGYCLLGRIIEELTDTTYEDHVRQTLLLFAGAGAMQLAGNGADERLLDEVLYMGSNDENPYDIPVRRMDAHGGWLATPSELMHILLQVDGLPMPADIINAASITTMTTTSTANANYGCGWEILPSGDWKHTGSLPGTSTVLYKTAANHGWAVLCSTRTDITDADLFGELDALMKAVDALV